MVQKIMLRLNKTANSIDTEKVKQPNLDYRNFFYIP